MGNHLKRVAVSAALAVSIGSSAFAATAKIKQHLDLMPDATSEEYQAALKVQRSHLSSKQTLNDGLDDVLKTGERALTWIKTINAARDADHQISFTGPQFRSGNPIDKPSKYNAKIALDRYTAFLAQTPSSFKSVILGATPITASIPTDMTEADYLTQERNINRIYQTAARWRLMAPNLTELAGYAAGDVRGIYFLSNMKDRTTQLKGLAALPADQQTQIKEWLIEMCVNAENSRELCEPELNNSVEKSRGSALEFYQTYEKNSQSLYSSYFIIPDYGRRTDITFTSQNANVLSVPFTDPGNEGLRKFMLNVEDEWKLAPWNLRLNFVANKDSNTAHLEFQPGVTPHVNRLGGNVITMDANTPLNDWENGWIIRHEFGHVLGFPDCYVEFYQPSEQVMINYQLDTSNLMCSRMGNFKQTHYDELKRAYYTN